MNIKKLAPFVFFLFSGLRYAEAHCPLCTMGAAAATAGAVWLGVNNIVIGLFIGAFAVSTGWWVSNLIKKKYIPSQKPVIILVSYITTIIPISKLIPSIYPFYISLMGDYGSILNRTYIINPFVIGTVFGGIIVSIAPTISKKITILRQGRTISYQGVIITFLTLLIIGGLIQLIQTIK